MGPPFLQERRTLQPGCCYGPSLCPNGAATGSAGALPVPPRRTKNAQPLQHRPRSVGATLQAGAQGRQFRAGASVPGAAGPEEDGRADLPGAAPGATRRWQSGGCCCPCCCSGCCGCCCWPRPPVPAEGTQPSMAHPGCAVGAGHSTARVSSAACRASRTRCSALSWSRAAPASESCCISCSTCRAGVRVCGTLKLAGQH
jgi:hypothetical protein